MLKNLMLSKAFPFIAGGAILLIVALGGVVTVQHYRMVAKETALSTAKADLKSAEDDLADTVAAYEDYKTDAQGKIDKLATLAAENAARADAAQQTEEKIRNEPDENDDGVAPVLYNSLMRMRR